MTKCFVFKHELKIVFLEHLILFHKIQLLREKNYINVFFHFCDNVVCFNLQDLSERQIKINIIDLDDNLPRFINNNITVG